MTKAILCKTISVGPALAQLNGTLLNLPKPALYLDTIYLQEARASSEVENIITTHDDLYKSYVSEKKIENLAAKEVLSYKEAFWLGLEELKSKPFIADGNGRTGRILLLLYLKVSGLLEVPAIYLNDYIIQNKSKYCTKLQGMTENNN